MEEIRGKRNKDKNKKRRVKWECKCRRVLVHAHSPQSTVHRPCVPRPAGPSRISRLLSAANTATCTQADNVKYHSRTYRPRQQRKQQQQIHGTTKDISAIAAALGQNSTGPESAIGIWVRGLGLPVGLV